MIFLLARNMLAAKQRSETSLARSILTRIGAFDLKANFEKILPQREIHGQACIGSQFEIGAVQFAVVGLAEQSPILDHVHQAVPPMSFVAFDRAQGPVHPFGIDDRAIMGVTVGTISTPRRSHVGSEWNRAGATAPLVGSGLRIGVTDGDVCERHDRASLLLPAP